MRPLLLIILFVALLLAGCDARRPATTEATRPGRPPAPAAAPPVAPVGPAGLPERDYTRAPFSLDEGPADTLVQLGGRRYWLSVQVATDSARPVRAARTGVVGPYFAAPAARADSAGPGQVQGYYETYTFTLRDSARQRMVWRRQLHKADFAGLGSPALVTVMNLPRPRYLGYSAAQQSLVFCCILGIPSSDVAARATLVLGAADGRVRRLSDGGSAIWEATDCAPQLSPSGATILTCTELLRPGRPPLKLTRPHANLTVARFLTDTTLLLVYERGDYVQPAPAPDSTPANVSADFYNPEFRTTPAQRRLPTAYVLGTSGRELARFRLAASSDGMRHELLCTFAPALHAYLLAQDDSKLVLLPTAHPDSLRELPLRTLPRFRPPLRPHEQRYDIPGTFTSLTVYVDTLHPRRLRYQLRQQGS